MTTLIERPAWAALWADDAEVALPAPAPRLTSSLVDAAPSTWLWCFRCERAFQRAEVGFDGDSVHCVYADCAGSALDFWQWDAYQAFVGGTQAPSHGVRYPMAQGG